MISYVAQVNLRESASGLSQIVEINCSATSNADYGIKFFIVAMDRATNNTVSTSELISCTTNTHTLEIANASCSRVYSVYAQFSFPNGSQSSCLLSNTTTINSGVCPTSDAPTERKSYTQLYSCSLVITDTKINIRSNFKHSGHSATYCNNWITSTCTVCDSHHHRCFCFEEAWYWNLRPSADRNRSWSTTGRHQTKRRICSKTAATG